MRKFKFVGTESNAKCYIINTPEIGKVYRGDAKVGMIGTVEDFASSIGFYEHEWEEVFDTIEDKISELKELAKSQGMDCEVVLKEVPKRLEVIASGYDVNHYRKHSCFEAEFYIYNDNDAKNHSYAGLANFLAKQLETYLNEEKK